MSYNQHKALIETASELLESFNAPLPTQVIPDDSILHQMGSFSASMIGGDNFKMHKIPETGYIIQFDKDGATEVHHVDENLQGGYKQNVPEKSAIRFASTMANHVKSLLDENKTVRITAHKNLSGNFKRITDRLIARHPEYSVSSAVSSTHEITGDPVVSWEIKKSLTEALSSSTHKAMATKAANSTAKNGLTAAEQISKDVMPTDRVIIPIQRSSTPDESVIQHLSLHGYNVDDYTAGIASHKMTPTRKIKIGKILGATNASPVVKQRYEKDPARQGIKTTAYAVISRNPRDVAAMSTHQNWESCQTLGGKATVDGNVREQEKGSRSDMVPGIVASGAHIAYLVKHPDDIDKHYKPIARVTLNPYVGTDETGAKHTILRPSKVYGEEWSGFHKTVSDWAEKNFPEKGPEYTRHSDAYPEGEDSISNYSPKFNEFWKKNFNLGTALKHPNQEVLSHYTDKVLQPEGKHFVSNLAANPHLSDKDMDRLVNHYANTLQAGALAKNARTPQQLTKIFDSQLGNNLTALSMSSNKNATSGILHDLFDAYGLGKTSTPGERVEAHNGHSPTIINHIMNHPNADDSHFSKMFEHKSFSDKHAPSDGGHNAAAWDSYLDHTDSLKTIARRYTSEDVGRKLITLQTKLPAHDHDIVYDVAEKHPHLLRDIPDSSIAYAYGRHPMSKNLENMAIGRNTPETLTAVAKHTGDINILSQLENHPDQSVSGNAKARKHLMNLGS